MVWALPLPHPGGVLAFLGEGGERAMARRIEAVASHKGADPEALADRLQLWFRVPHLAARGTGHADRERKAEATIASGLRGGAAKPRQRRGGAA